MKVTFIPIVVGEFGTLTNGLLKGLEDLEIEGRVVTKLQHWWELLEYREEPRRFE